MGWRRKNDGLKTDLCIIMSECSSCDMTFEYVICECIMHNINFWRFIRRDIIIFVKRWLNNEIEGNFKLCFVLLRNSKVEEYSKL